MPSRREFLRSVPGAAGAVLAAPLVLPLVLPLGACDPREFARSRGATLRLSIAAGNVGGVFYPYAGAIANAITRRVPNVAATAEVTGGTIDNMQFIRQGTADLGFATADMLDEAYRGAGVFARVGRIPVRTVATLYYSYLHVATLERTGIRALADLKGRVVSVGSAGSSTEIIALRMLRAAGLDPARDVTRQNLGIAAAADGIRDGKVDALVWIGGVPTGAILELASSPTRRLVLLDNAQTLPAIAREHGGAPYIEDTIRAGGYPGVTADVRVIGLANLLVADSRMSPDLVYEITRTLFAHRGDIVAVHAEAQHLNAASAARGSPIPYHEGAQRFFRERGVWTS